MEKYLQPNSASSHPSKKESQRLNKDEDYNFSDFSESSCISDNEKVSKKYNPEILKRIQSWASEALQNFSYNQDGKWCKTQGWCHKLWISQLII